MTSYEINAIENKLKTCPFCGSKAVLKIDSWSYRGKDAYWIECPKCGIKHNAYMIDVEDAVSIWNNRSSPWIDVKEKLPKETGTYLVNIHQENDTTGDVGDMVVKAMYQPNEMLFVPKEAGWTLLNEWYDFSSQLRNDISHWMPIPDPPEFND